MYRIQVFFGMVENLLLQWEKIIFFNELCEKNNLKLEQSIIINGSCLHKKYLRIFIRLL